MLRHMPLQKVQPCFTSTDLLPSHLQCLIAFPPHLEATCVGKGDMIYPTLLTKRSFRRGVNGKKCNFPSQVQENLLPQLMA